MVSFPRSGQHLVEKILKYWCDEHNIEFKYCEFYGCCNSIPCVNGNEISKTITPLEAGLGFAVKLDTGDFIGKDVLVKQKQEKTSRRICGVELLDKGINVLKDYIPKYNSMCLLNDKTYKDNDKEITDKDNQQYKIIPREYVVGSTQN